MISVEPVHLPSVFTVTELAVVTGMDMALAEVVYETIIPEIKAMAAEFTRSGRWVNSVHAEEVTILSDGSVSIAIVADPKNPEGRGYGAAVEKGTGIYAGESPIVIMPVDAEILAFDNGRFAAYAVVQGQPGKHLIRDTVRSNREAIRSTLAKRLKEQMHG